MNKRSWFHYRLRYMKAPDGDGAGGGGATPSGSDAGTASPPSGDGGGSSVATPSDGGSSSPAGTPSTDSPDPWAALGEVDLDYIEAPAPTPVAPVTPPVAAQPPVQPQTPPVAPQAPVDPNAPPVQPQAQTPQAPAPQAPQTDLSPSDPVGMAAAMEQNAPALIQHLAETRFQLTPEEVQEVETDAVAAIPKLLAKVHLHSQIAMQRFLAQAVPGMIQRHTQVSTANSEAENKFFDTHKALGLDKTNTQHRQAAVRLAKMYRQMYPQAPLDQLIQDIGPMVVKAVGAVPGAPQPQAQAQAPGTVMAGGVPFRPAVNGGGVPVPQQAPQTDNPWSGMGATYD